MIFVRIRRLVVFLLAFYHGQHAFSQNRPMLPSIIPNIFSFWYLVLHIVLLLLFVPLLVDVLCFDLTTDLSRDSFLYTFVSRSTRGRTKFTFVLLFSHSHSHLMLSCFYITTCSFVLNPHLWDFSKTIIVVSYSSQFVLLFLPCYVSYFYPVNVSVNFHYFRSFAL